MKILAALLIVISPFAEASMLDNLPIFWAATGNNSAYHDAAFKAQEAFLLQSGMDYRFDKFSNRVTNKLQNSAVQFVDEETPLSSKEVTTAGAIAYIGITKRFTTSFANPIWPKLHNTLILSQYSGMLEFNFNF